MEFTSVLAGERFSDHPGCTDPVLAALARAVNDCTSDIGRGELAALAPQLIGAVGGPAAAGFAVVRRVLLTALALATGSRRHVLIVALLGLDRAAAGRRRGCPLGSRSPDTELALLGEDVAQRRAAEVVAATSVTPAGYLRRGAPRAVEMAVATIAADSGDPDRALVALLRACLADYRATASSATAPALNPAPARHTPDHPASA